MALVGTTIESASINAGSEPYENLRKILIILDAAQQDSRIADLDPRLFEGALQETQDLTELERELVKESMPLIDQLLEITELFADEDGKCDKDCSEKIVLQYEVDGDLDGVFDAHKFPLNDYTRYYDELIRTGGKIPLVNFKDANEALRVQFSNINPEQVSFDKLSNLFNVERLAGFFRTLMPVFVEDIWHYAGDRLSTCSDGECVQFKKIYEDVLDACECKLQNNQVMCI